MFIVGFCWSFSVDFMVMFVFLCCASLFNFLSQSSSLSVPSSKVALVV